MISAEYILSGASDENMDSAGQSNQASTISVAGIHSGDALSAGDVFILMKADNMTQNAEGKIFLDVAQAQQGISLLCDVETEMDALNNKVIATIMSRNGAAAARVNPRLQALSEGYLAAAMLVTRGADFIAYDTRHQNPKQRQRLDTICRVFGQLRLL